MTSPYNEALMRFTTLLVPIFFLMSGCVPAGPASSRPPPPASAALALTPAQAASARDGYVNRLIQNRDRKEEAKGARNTYYAVALSGIIAGAAGGIYGLTTDDDRAKTTAGITSLVSGGLTAILTTFGLDARARDRETCIRTLNNRINHMTSFWSEEAFQAAAVGGIVPAEVWAAYREDVTKSNELISSLRCD
jgi:hypothetical protein